MLRLHAGRRLAKLAEYLGRRRKLEAVPCAAPARGVPRQVDATLLTRLSESIALEEDPPVERTLYGAARANLLEEWHGAGADELG
eukprot:4972988-Prymnesium_polylepis.1